MSIAFSLLLVSIVATPALIAFDGPAAQSLVGVLAVAMLAVIAASTDARDVIFASRATRRLKVAAAVPAIWIIIQLLPMPLHELSHSIWANADEALSQRSSGHVSIDVGKTFEALIFYAANIAIVIAAIFVTKDHRRAGDVLVALTGIIVLIAIILAIVKFVPVAAVPAEDVAEMLAAVSSLGVILSMATGVRAIERSESRRPERENQATESRPVLALAGIGLLACILGLAASATLNVGLVAAFGAITFGSIQLTRRARLAGWTTVILTATLMIAATMIIFWRYNYGSSPSPLLQFASAAPADSVSLAESMLSDANWLGTGAGTYGSLLPIYQQLGSLVTKAPTTASALAIELGRMAAAYVFLLAFGIIIILYVGALKRGRDSCYSAAAAAGMIILLGEAFCDASLLHSCVIVLADIVIGLGLAQHISSGTAA